MSVTAFRVDEELGKKLRGLYYESIGDFPKNNDEMLTNIVEAFTENKKESIVFISPKLTKIVEKKKSQQAKIREKKK